MSAVNGAAPLLLAVDGGGTKTDVAVIDLDGTLVARCIGPHVVPQVIGAGASLDAICELATTACVEAGVDPDRLHALAGAVFLLAGIDLPIERDAYLTAARDRIPAPVLVDNDALAVAHAGLTDARGVAVACGTGANVVVVGPNGIRGRYRAIGEIAGDRAGGFLVGLQALYHAARSEDGRGASTMLERLVPAQFDLPTAGAVAEALHLGNLPYEALAGLMPVIMDAADDGDIVAGRLLDDLADELAVMVTALVRRVPPDASGDLPVVLGGGVLQAGNRRLIERFTRVLLASLPHARVEMLDRPPVAGSAIAALRLAGASAGAFHTIQRADWRRR